MASNQQDGKGKKVETKRILVKTALVPIAKLSSDHNARKEIGDVKDLADSMLASGQVVPIVVVENADGTYHIDAGHRRVAAAKSNGWTEIRAEIYRHDDSDTFTRRIRGLAENVGRSALMPWEIMREVADLKKIAETNKIQLSGEKLGSMVGLDGKSVNNYLRVERCVNPQILKEWPTSQPLATMQEMFEYAANKDSDSQLERWRNRNRKGDGDPQGGGSGGEGKEGRKPPTRTVKKADDIRDMRDAAEKAPESAGRTMVLIALRWILGENDGAELKALAGIK